VEIGASGVGGCCCFAGPGSICCCWRARCRCIWCRSRGFAHIEARYGWNRQGHGRTQHRRCGSRAAQQVGRVDSIPLIGRPRFGFPAGATDHSTSAARVPALLLGHDLGLACDRRSASGDHRSGPLRGPGAVSRRSALSPRSTRRYSLRLGGAPDRARRRSVRDQIVDQGADVSLPHGGNAPAGNGGESAGAA